MSLRVWTTKAKAKQTQTLKSLSKRIRTLKFDRLDKKSFDINTATPPSLAVAGLKIIREFHGKCVRIIRGKKQRLSIRIKEKIGDFKSPVLPLNNFPPKLFKLSW